MMVANLLFTKTYLWTCLLGIEPFLSQKNPGMLVATIGFACGYEGVVESFSCSTWLSCDSRYCGGQKHVGVQRWMEPGSLNGCSAWWYRSSLRLQHFQTWLLKPRHNSCMKNLSRAVRFPALFSYTVFSHYWVTLLGCYCPRRLQLMIVTSGLYKHFMLKLGWTHTHTHAVIITFSQLCFYTLCLLSSHWKPLNVRHIRNFSFFPKLVLSRSLAYVEIKLALLASEFVLGKIGVIYNVSLSNI